MNNMLGRYLIFGPPGAGKSTLCLQLRAFDLEALENKQRRIQKVEIAPGVYGAADVAPSDVSHIANVYFIVLRMPDDVYQERRRVRDAHNPSKADQAHYRIDQFLIEGDNVISVDGSGDVKTTANLVSDAIIANERRLFGLA